MNCNIVFLLILSICTLNNATDKPTMVPTSNPNMVPTSNPTMEPTMDTKSPSFQPTFNPLGTDNPTQTTTPRPSFAPTSNPTAKPTEMIDPSKIWVFKIVVNVNISPKEIVASVYINLCKQAAGIANSLFVTVYLKSVKSITFSSRRRRMLDSTGSELTFSIGTTNGNDINTLRAVMANNNAIFNTNFYSNLQQIAPGAQSNVVSFNDQGQVLKSDFIETEAEDNFGEKIASEYLALGLIMIFTALLWLYFLRAKIPDSYPQIIKNSENNNSNANNNNNNNNNNNDDMNKPMIKQSKKAETKLNADEPLLDDNDNKEQEKQTNDGNETVAVEMTETNKPKNTNTTGGKQENKKPEAQKKNEPQQQQQKKKEVNKSEDKHLETQQTLEEAWNDSANEENEKDAETAL